MLTLVRLLFLLWFQLRCSYIAPSLPTSLVTQRKCLCALHSVINVPVLSMDTPAQPNHCQKEIITRGIDFSFSLYFFNIIIIKKSISRKIIAKSMKNIFM